MTGYADALQMMHSEKIAIRGTSFQVCTIVTDYAMFIDNTEQE